ncbi:MAG: tetratricopeptide repeat protein [Flavobacteriia bacterium]|jgi:tetratricopeptide (TPR) repeat protein|nr:tetratricopeptide repeat protein [Flavobacteriia bacterium]NBY41376.1 tetratricopeptide repeat protein [Flavobacteriia bacterium]
MTGFIIRISIALGFLGGVLFMFLTGNWGWGIFLLFPLAVVTLSFFRNENMILALNQMRLGNQDKAKKYINKISSPQFLPKKQHAYVLYLKAIMNSQEIGFAQSEVLLRKALALGLRTSEDNAVARMHLAGVCAQTGRKSEALSLLAEAKKIDKKGVVKDQVKMMQQQLQTAPSKNQMRMAQMMGGRKKSPKSR